MSSYFILGDSYSVHTFIHNIDYVLDDNIDFIYLLGEHHSKNEYFNSRLNNKIKIEDSLESCIINSDVIFIFEECLLSTEKKDAIINLVKNYQKQYMLIKSSFREKCLLDDKDQLEQHQKCPSILILSVGDYTQLFSVEIELNKRLSELTEIKQQFSDVTQSMIFELNQYGIINSKKLLPQQKTSFSLQLFSLHIDYFEQLFADKTMRGYFEKNIPDVVILCVNSRTEIPESFIVLLKYIYKLPICVIIRSEYIPIYNQTPDSIPLLYQNCETRDDLYESCTFAIKEIFDTNILIDNILPHIYLPEGVLLIK